MQTCHYEILLRSDAEPASGLGGELLNSLLPRDEYGRIIIPASHLKGLMRENLHNLLAPLRKDAVILCNEIFGRSGEDGDGGAPGILHLTSAVAEKPVILTVTRTSLENGRAKDSSLRTSEALGAGTVLKGILECDSDDPVFQKFCRLALLSVSALGGGRTRGCGACKIRVMEHPDETPGGLLKTLFDAKPEFSGHLRIVHTPDGNAGTRFKAVKLYFEAESPLCLPEHPHGKNNVISSGFTIPGTAVAGTLLTLLSEVDRDLASACFRSEYFRCFPLLPVRNPETCILPVQVSNTHKMSKCRDENLKRYLFGDLMIPDRYLDEEYRWEKKTAHISMKGSDGVLIVRKNGVELLKGNLMPRYYTAHGVVNGSGEKKDNLFTMESVCMKEFSGCAVLPELAADRLLAQLKNGRRTFFGKSKSTMGTGVLRAEEWALFSELDTNFPQVERLRNRLFIVQTPIVYEDSPEANTREILNRVLSEAGWGEADAESVMTAILFGWNSLGLGTMVGNTGRLKAKRVISPGSVFLLKEPLQGLPEKIARGLGTDRYAGYGAVLPHPMFASRICEIGTSGETETLSGSSRSNPDPVYRGYELDQLCGIQLSASQIAHLMRCAQISALTADAFLENQKLSRPDRIWSRWKPLYKPLKQWLSEYPQPEILEMIRVWHDLRIGRKAR